MALVDETLWRRLSPHIDRALELAGAERDELVRSVAAGDPELGRVLATHLAAHDRAAESGFLEAGAGTISNTLEGQVLGPYTLVARLGVGGMGTVWRARRSDGRFEGDVAIKLLHPSLFDETGFERFRREGTLLSGLNHPGIARLFDAGLAPSGQPYLVLELVDGERIDRWADQRRLTVRQRVELLLQVTDAVADAHAQLVVHRDLKPSNLLVDRAGRVKLLDFGVAGLVDATSGEVRRRTLTAGAMTPDYAAPEQLEGGAITTATDVHALGVLLYELLTGEHPVARADTSPAELVRAITAVEPPRMSDRLRRLPAGAPSAAARGESREHLARSLEGDLDLIVARALKKSPAERYPTVTAFAQDLRHWLDDRPVSARPDSPLYRMRKLVRRRKLESAAVAVAVVALVASTAIAWRQARLSSADRDLALRDLERAEIASDFSAFLLSEEAPAESSVSKAKLLARGERAIERRFAGDPSLQAYLLVSLSQHYYENFQFDDWRRILERAWTLAEPLPEPRLQGQVACLTAQSRVNHGEVESGLALFARSADLLAGLAGADLERARCARAESEAALTRGEVELAIERGERALAIERARRGPPGRVSEVLNTLANAYSAGGRFAAADRIYAELLALLEAQGRERTQTAAIVQNNRTVSLHSAGQYLAALRESEKAVALARELNPDRGAPPTALWTYGSLLSLVGRHGEAVAAVEEAVAKTREGGLPWQIFWANSTSTRTLDEAGRLREADERYAALRAFVESQKEIDTGSRAAWERTEARGRWIRGDFVRARELARSALARLDEAKRPAREILPALVMAAISENAAGDPRAALAAAGRAERIALDRLGEFEHSFQLGQARFELALARKALGDASAAPTLDSAIANFRAATGEGGNELRRARALREEWARAGD